MKYFEIKGTSNMTALAWALACAHVPGFQIVEARGSKRGRKKEWHGGKLQKLYDDVRAVKTRHGYNDRQALKFLSNNAEFAPAWGPPEGYGNSRKWIETLESRLQDAKRYVARIESLEVELEAIRRRHSKKFRKL
jgi:hypothetical protein